MTKLVDFYRMIDDEYDHHDLNSEQEDDKTPFQLMREKQREMNEMKPAFLTIDTMIDMLEGELPPMPE